MGEMPAVDRQASMWPREEEMAGQQETTTMTGIPEKRPRNDGCAEARICRDLSRSGTESLGHGHGLLLLYSQDSLMALLPGCIASRSESAQVERPYLFS